VAKSIWPIFLTLEGSAFFESPSTAKTENITKIFVAAYHLSSKFDLLDMSVSGIIAAFFCILPSENSGKALKSRKNGDSRRSLGCESVSILNLV
jgi:hypothetical protein